MRPCSINRPVLGKPSESCIVATDRDVRAATDGGKLFAVLEDAAAYSLFFDLGGSAVLVGHGDEVIYVQHGTDYRLIYRSSQRFYYRYDFLLASVRIPT